MGVSRSAGRVARSSSVSALDARRFASPRLSGSVVAIVAASLRPVVRAVRPGNQKRPFVPGRKVVPSAVPPSFGDAALMTDGTLSLPIGAALYRWRSAPEPTERYRRWVRRLPGPFAAAVVPVSTSHRVSLPTLDGYSSRSQPVLRDV